MKCSKELVEVAKQLKDKGYDLICNEWYQVRVSRYGSTDSEIYSAEPNVFKALPEERWIDLEDLIRNEVE